MDGRIWIGKIWQDANCLICNTKNSLSRANSCIVKATLTHSYSFKRNIVQWAAFEQSSPAPGHNLMPVPNTVCLCFDCFTEKMLTTSYYQELKCQSISRPFQKAWMIFSEINICSIIFFSFFYILYFLLFIFV